MAVPAPDQGQGGRVRKRLLLVRDREHQLVRDREHQDGGEGELTRRSRGEAVQPLGRGHALRFPSARLSPL